MKPLSLIKKMLITEKAANAQAIGKYVFIVDSSATKSEIKKAMKELYKVDAVKVTTLRQRPIRRRYKASVTMKRAPKKAVVTVKDGQKIELQ